MISGLFQDCVARIARGVDYFERQGYDVGPRERATLVDFAVRRYDRLSSGPMRERYERMLAKIRDRHGPPVIPSIV